MPARHPPEDRPDAPGGAHRTAAAATVDENLPAVPGPEIIDNDVPVAGVPRLYPAPRPRPALQKPTINYLIIIIIAYYYAIILLD